jgi:hypothetical protein
MAYLENKHKMNYVVLNTIGMNGTELNLLGCGFNAGSS